MDHYFISTTHPFVVISKPNIDKKHQRTPAMEIKKLAQEVFEIEAQEIANLRHRLDENFEKSIQAILDCSGKVIVSGMGKSGIIGKKIVIHQFLYIVF